MEQTKKPIAWQKLATSILVVLSVLLVLIWIIYFGLIFGALTGSGLFGMPADASDIRIFNLGIVIVSIEILLSVLSWKRQNWLRLAIVFVCTGLVYVIALTG